MIYQFNLNKLKYHKLKDIRILLISLIFIMIKILN